MREWGSGRFASEPTRLWTAFRPTVCWAVYPNFVTVGASYRLHDPLIHYLCPLCFQGSISIILSRQINSNVMVSNFEAMIF